MSQVPWWGVPVVAGIFAFGGVLAAQIVTIRLDRLRSNREDLRRWLIDRRRIYASLLAEADRTYIRISLEWGTDKRFHEYADNLTALRFCCQEVRLMSNAEVEAAAWALQDSLVKVTSAPSARQSDRFPEWATEYNDLVKVFVKFAKADLVALDEGRKRLKGRLAFPRTAEQSRTTGESGRSRPSA